MKKIYITETQYKNILNQFSDEDINNFANEYTKCNNQSGKNITEDESYKNKYIKIANNITNNIPTEFKQKVDEYLNTKKLVQFKVKGVTVFIYDSSINRTQTGTPIYPKYIYLNVDYLSDVPNVVLMSQSNIYIKLYYAFMHEMGHIESKIPPESMPDVDYEKYINSKAEKHAMEYADKWLLSYLN